jgi:hypothetical protein
VVVSSADPYITTNNSTKHLVSSGGNGWIATGGVIVLRGVTDYTMPSVLNSMLETLKESGSWRMGRVLNLDFLSLGLGKNEADRRER